VNIDEDRITTLKRRLLGFLEGSSLAFAAEVKLDALYA
jgi:hypothetical protein